MANFLTLKVNFEPKCYRTLLIKETDSLENLAEAILNSYEFNYDHAFGFYDNIKNYHKSKEIYTLFADMEDSEDDPLDGKSVYRTKIRDVFHQGKKMLFLFDYGDGWIFLVECLDDKQELKRRPTNPVIESKGDSPQQYPDYNDDDDDDDDDDEE